MATQSQHHVRLGDFRVWLVPTASGFKWVNSGEQCDDCGNDAFTRKGQLLTCDKCGSEYTIHGPAIADANATNPNPSKEDTMAKTAKPATKSTRRSSSDDLGLDAPARKKSAPAAKREKTNRLAGKKLAPTEKGLAARDGSLRGSIVAAFKGGRTYETGVANLCSSVRKSPRGKTGADLKALLISKVSSAVRRGLLKVV